MSPALKDDTVLQPLHVEVHVGEEVCVVRFEGSLDASRVHQVDAMVDALETTPVRSLVVDASLLWEIDEAGVECLDHVREVVGALGARMSVYAASGEVARALNGGLTPSGHGRARHLT